jgi:hypothetical protein
MMTDLRHEDLVGTLDAYGADLSRWPAERVRDVRRALLARPDFRRAVDEARLLDKALANAREELDGVIDASHASARVERRVLARVLPDPLAGLRWQRIAAAMLVAGMLGGAIDLLMPDPAADAPDLVMLDPLSAEDTELR